MAIAISGWRGTLSEGDRVMIYNVLRSFQGQRWNVGDCPTGVDAYVRERFKFQAMQVFHADWSVGRQAGPIRNQRMIRGVTVLVAFPGPRSPGTRNAIEIAISRGIETHVYPIGGAW